jgi:hypothetical protein
MTWLKLGDYHHATQPNKGEKIMPVRIKFLFETKTASLAEALAWISPDQVDLTHWDAAVKQRFAIFLRNTNATYGFLQGAECVRDFERHDGTEFWKLVKSEPQSIQSNIIHIDVSVRNFNYGQSGIRYFKAERSGEGRWRLTGANAADNDTFHFTAVYWLPYLAGATTSENRATFEGTAGIDFFMTFELSGCRFAVNDSHVYHVAFDAGTTDLGNKQISTPSKRNRDISLMSSPGAKAGGRMRSLSISGDDEEESFNYGIGLKTESCRAVVFGSRGAANRAGEAWVYKAFLFNHAASNPSYTGKAWCVIFDKERYPDGKLWLA